MLWALPTREDPAPALQLGNTITMQSTGSHAVTKCTEPNLEQ